MNRTCTCSQPPGGKITCRIDQLAICGIVDGEIKRGCFDPPGGLSRYLPAGVENYQDLANWILSQIMAVYRDGSQDISPDEMTIVNI